MKMKIEWYLKLCQGIFQNKKDLIEQKCGKELTRLPMNCTYWVVDCKDSAWQLRLWNLSAKEEPQHGKI